MMKMSTAYSHCGYSCRTAIRAEKGHIIEQLRIIRRP